MLFTFPMTFDPMELQELQSSIADRLYLQIASWHLYLGDAGLANDLAIACIAYLDQGASVAAKQAIESVIVPLAGGNTSLPLARLMPPAQLNDLEEILVPYCR